MPDLSELHNLQGRHLQAQFVYLYTRRKRDQAIASAIHAGASYGQVARVLGIPRGTVQSIVRKVDRADCPLPSSVRSE